MSIEKETVACNNERSDRLVEYEHSRAGYLNEKVDEKIIYQQIYACHNDKAKELFRRRREAMFAKGKKFMERKTDND